MATKGSPTTLVHSVYFTLKDKSDAAIEEFIALCDKNLSDHPGVEYYFANLSDPAHDSGWQASASYVDTGLAPGTSYSYRVSARDKSSAQNATAPSASAAATTDPDTVVRG